MALIEKISSSDLFYMACRMDRGDSFGYAGWRAIGEYLEELSYNTGEDIEIDIVGICCEYHKADSAQEVPDQYDTDIDPEEWEEMDEEEKLEAIENYLQENTSVVTCQENLIIWQAF